MPQATEVVLETALKALLAEQSVLDKKIRALKSALAVLSGGMPARRLRRPMSRAEKKNASKRMKAYWAKRKANS